MRVTTAVLLSALSTTMFAQTIQVNKDNRTIAITATGTAVATADQAVLTVGYIDYGMNEGGAYAAGSRRSNAIIAVLDRSGVDKDKVESLDQQLQPLNEFEIKELKAEQKSFRYRITQSWTIVTTPEKAGRILDDAVKAGANHSGSIEWEMKEPDRLEGRAAEKAIAHAQRIATQMAEGLKIHLGPLVYASNQVDNAAQPIVMASRMANFVSDKVVDAEPLSIRSRKVSRSITVYAVFAVQE